MDQPAQIDTAPRRRRWRQYSLRTGLILVVLLSLLFAWYGSHVRQHRREMAAIRELGNIFYVGRPSQQVDFLPESLRSRPEFLRVGVIHFLQSNPSAEEMILLAQFSELVRVVFMKTSFDDRHAQLLLPLDTLLSLDLEGSRVTASSLETVSRLENLRNLALHHTTVTDEGIAYLNGMASLETLSLNRTDISGKGLAALDRLPSLVHLDLGGTPIEDDDLALLARYGSLQTLALADSQITDAGITHLKSLPNLRRLEIGQTEVTDEGVRQLEEALPNLTVLDD